VVWSLSLQSGSGGPNLHLLCSARIQRLYLLIGPPSPPGAQVIRIANRAINRLAASTAGPSVRLALRTCGPRLGRSARPALKAPHCSAAARRIPPWGVPMFVSLSVPSSPTMPALRNAFTRARMFGFQRADGGDPAGPNAKFRRRKRRHTAHLREFPETVRIQREHHPLAGKPLRIFGWMHRHGNSS